MPTRRDVICRIGLASAAALVDPGLAAAQPSSFAGARAGELRVFEDVRLRWCPPGRFTMGSPPTEAGRRADEAQVEVTLTRGFWMAAFETTQGQWQRIAGAFPDQPPTAAFGLGEAFPIYWVNYAEAEGFCRALSERARRASAIPAGVEFRLPTEAQWEYACRAGTTAATAFGDRVHRGDANYKIDPGLDGDGPPSAGRATPAGAFRANAWDIHDMYGNVFEWCRDWYHAKLPGGVDPDVQVKGAPNRDGSYSRVRRGAAWNDDATWCRSAMRLRYEPERRSDHIGFRVVLVAV
jgi:formylglycine-generating enzyme